MRVIKMNKIDSKAVKEKIASSDFVTQTSAFIKKIKNREYAFELSKRTVIFMAFIIAGVIFGDQLTKMLADRKLMEMQSYEIIDNFFYFTYVHNYGMAWSMLDGARWLFLIITPLALAGMIYFFFATKKHEVLTRYGIVLVFGGAVGNYIDRLLLGYVRDFIQFYIFGYDFPIFNVADIAVVIGMGMIILEIFIQEYQIWKLSKSL